MSHIENADTSPGNQQAHTPHHHHAPRRAYFEVGRMVLVAEHDASKNNADLKTWVDALWQQHDLTGNPRFQYGTISTVFSYSGARGETISMLAIAITALLHNKLDTSDQQTSKDTDLINIVNRLNEGALDSTINEITLRSATPDWCATGCIHGVGHVTPGAKPRPVTDDEVMQHGHKYDTTKFDILTQRQQNAANAKSPSNGEGDGSRSVNVVIFDTAPPRDRLDEAYGKFESNYLLQQLRENEQKDGRTQQKFTIKYAKELGIALPDSLDMGEDGGYGHQDEYDMSDHGLFIAGTIRSIAPEANIYLVQTQNDTGVGTITTLAQGIDALIRGRIIEDEEEMKWPLIVNCSLCIEFQTLQELVDNLHLSRNGRIPGDLNSILPEQIELVTELLSLYMPLRRLNDYFNGESNGGIRIIAAAGNDGIPESESTDPNYAPPPARYPAAFDFVLGVGAMQQGTSRAWYSNIADAPPSVGLMVFGGKADRVNGKNTTNDQGAGMMGLYVGKFPGGTCSENGWAWWSGTSFATGVMSGIFARAAKLRPIQRGAANDIRNDLQSRKDGITTQGEPFITTPQQV